MRLRAIDDNGNTMAEFPLEPEDFAGWLRVQRESAGLSLQDVGRACGVRRQAVFAWEKGGSLPIVSHMVKLVLLFRQAPAPRRDAPILSTGQEHNTRQALTQPGPC